MPKPGFLPQMSQTAAIGVVTLPAAPAGPPSGDAGAGGGAAPGEPGGCDPDGIRSRA
jgi:hypothetical protein